MQEFIISLIDVEKKYKKNKVLSEITLNICKGESFGILGENGAGKSTLLSLMAGIQKPTKGQILFEGRQLSVDSKKAIGFVPQDIALYETLSGRDNLIFWGRAAGLKGASLKERIDCALDMVALMERCDDLVGRYSGGMKRRLNIAASLLHSPRLLIMDEPTVGIDIKTRKALLSAFRDLQNQGVTLVFTSHTLEDLDFCQRLLILHEGRIQDLGNKEEVLSGITG